MAEAEKQDSNRAIDSTDASVNAQEEPAESQAPRSWLRGVMCRLGTGKMGLFERFLSLWVLIAMVTGTLIGYYAPSVQNALDRITVEKINFAIAILLWFMMLPMLMEIDFSTIKSIKRAPSAGIITCSVNWLVKPFTGFAIGILFFRGIFVSQLSSQQQEQYVAGAVALTAAPCTAMVFVWSTLVEGDAAFTVAQVALNDLLLLALFAPIVGGLTTTTNVTMPWDVVILSTVIYVIVPLILAVTIRQLVIRYKGLSFFQNTFMPKWKPVTIIGLTLTVVIIFITQADAIATEPLRVLMIAVPLILQTFLIFGIAYGLMVFMRVDFRFAAPGALIGASNFFELAASLTSSVWGPDSGAALVAVVGVLVEVPIMLALVQICNSTRERVFRPIEDVNADKRKRAYEAAKECLLVAHTNVADNTEKVHKVKEADEKLEALNEGDFPSIFEYRNIESYVARNIDASCGCGKAGQALN